MECVVIGVVSLDCPILVSLTASIVDSAYLEQREVTSAGSGHKFDEGAA